MNREIKFRAWEQNIKIMAYPSENLAMSGNEGYSHLEQSFCIDNRKINLASEDWDVEHEGMLPCILMQFTGLKDKNVNNNICIYEGDIISLDGINIGNIYENKNLLEDTTNLIITEMGCETWRSTEQEAIKRGCFYAK